MTQREVEAARRAIRVARTEFEDLAVGAYRELERHGLPFDMLRVGCFHEEMRRIGTLVVALGYGLSFVAVCLAACLMGPAVADHGCCPSDDGIRAADRDCCSVTPGVSHGGAHVADALPMLATVSAVPVSIVPPIAPTTPVTIATSPPLILRV